MKKLATNEVAVRILEALIQHHGCDKGRSEEMVILSCDITEILYQELKLRGERGERGEVVMTGQLKKVMP